MNGSLNEILPEPVSAANEEAILALITRKMKSAANMGVRILHAMEKRFGPEAREVLKDMEASMKPSPAPDAGDPCEDLHDFCDSLERGCTGSHRWERIVDEPGRVGYHFTRCAWAEIYRDLGEPEIGWLLCAADEPGVKSRNPKLGFKRTTVLMNGDDVCDHVFLVEDE
jgi:hypothetical protein